VEGTPSTLPKEVQDLLGPLEAVPLGVTVADLAGRILFVNERAARALGYAPEDLVGHPLEVLYGSTLGPEEVLNIRRETLSHGWRGEVTNIRRDGSRFPVFVETSTLRDTSGAPVAFMGVAWDITAQRAFQQRLLGEARLGTLGLIVHNVAHVVRNHLSAIHLSLYMLERSREVGNEEKIHFSIANEELNRIELFLRTLANYAQPPGPRFEESSLLEMVNRGLEDARPFLVAKSVTLIRQFPRSAPRVLVDRAQFAQAVTQVVQNACEALDRGGEIHVVVKRQPQERGVGWTVEIRDNGPGVAPHLEERVFEPFFSTSSHQLGLGLSNVRRILGLHGGEVSLSSIPGRGTAVTLRLPGR
jgi:PAS domain S-box-containing protein